MLSKKLWLFVCAGIAVTACDKGKSSGSDAQGKTAPTAEAAKEKSKADVFKIFDNHKEQYKKCEKLRQAMLENMREAIKAKKTPPVDTEYRPCHSSYWAAVKKDIGPLDQKKLDAYFAEWRKDVK